MDNTLQGFVAPVKDYVCLRGSFAVQNQRPIHKQAQYDLFLGHKEGSQMFPLMLRGRSANAVAICNDPP